MEFANLDEFWKALGWLYDDILETKESVKDLREATGHLLSVAEKHQLVVESHERRLDRTEITVEAILEDLRRHRQGRPPQ